MRILIIEDEQYTAKDLAGCILELRSHFQVIKILNSVKEATAFLKSTNEYDLIFSDIQLGDGLSFDIYNAVQPSAPVIFCTAYNNYAIDAFKANGIDYVLKPISKQAIQLAIEKYERLTRPSAGISGNMEQLLEYMQKEAQSKTNTSLLVHHKDKIIPVRMEDIALFYIQNEGCRILSFEGNHYSVAETLEKIEGQAGNLFFRANRQYLVNRKAVKEVVQGFSRTHVLSLVLEFKDPIVVSKEKSPLLFKWLAEV
jgi:two-component system, LytTR family, response regulator LytT